MTAVETTDVIAGTWAIDVEHSEVAFIVRHMMVSNVRGRFNKFAGDIVTGENLLDSSVAVSIDMTSVDTNSEKRDTHLRSADFFDVEAFPTMTYTSSGVRPDGEGYLLDGELSLHGVTRPVPLHLKLTGVGPDAYGGTRIGVSATGTINRSDFGVTANMPVPGGGVVVSETIAIAIDVEGVLHRS